MKRILAVILLALTLTGCPSNPTRQAADPQVTVFAIKGGYEAALTLAVAYAQLPRCTTGTKAICSTQPIVDQTVRARNVARDAIASAEGAVRTPGFGQDTVGTALTAAQAALDAFKSVTNTLKIK